MANRITGDSDTLMYQGPATAEVYLDAAIRILEARFGVGAAEKYPEILAAMVNASALDFGAAIISRAIETAADAISGNG